MRVLLLGGTGAMGVSLSDILATRGDEVYITSRKERRAEAENIHYLLGDAHNDEFVSELLKKNKFDAIVDFMIYSSVEFREKAPILLNATEQYVFISSARVYADSRNTITEETPRLLDVCKDKKYLNTDEYALAKAREEDFLCGWQDKNWTIIRPYITYNVERLQLGGVEKDLWLRRGLNGKSIPFFNEIADCRTTMTFGGDVAKAIVCILGNVKALGEVFQLTGTDNLSWREVLDIYMNVLKEETGVDASVYWCDSTDKMCRSMYNYYQIKYDRKYDRIFDNTKLLSICDGHLEFMPMKEGLTLCLKQFLSNPVWGRQGNMRIEAFVDKQCREKPSSEIINDRSLIIKYMGWKYIPAIMMSAKKLKDMVTAW